MEGEQNIKVNSRSKIEIGGVREVGAFSDTQITLETTLGMMLIEGKELKIESFSSENGQIYINGTLDGLCYYGKESSTEKRGLFKKIFG